MTNQITSSNKTIQPTNLRLNYWREAIIDTVDRLRAIIGSGSIPRVEYNPRDVEAISLQKKVFDLASQMETTAQALSALLLKADLANFANSKPVIQSFLDQAEKHLSTYNDLLAQVPDEDEVVINHETLPSPTPEFLKNPPKTFKFDRMLDAINAGAKDLGIHRANPEKTLEVLVYELAAGENHLSQKGPESAIKAIEDNLS